MRRTFARVRVLAAATATAVLVHTTAAQALGLGEINVDSLLNQRFSAVIPLYEIDAEDLETLSLSLAPAEAFDRAGLERSDYLSSLEFVIKNDQGRPRVVISSSQVAHEPVMNLLVQARWSGGKLMREYTVLLDPPQLALPTISKPVKPPKPASEPPASAPAVVSAPPPAMAPAPVMAAKPAPAAKTETEFYETSTESLPKAPAKPAPAPVRKPEKHAEVAASAPAPGGASYGPVQAQETLWSIATRLRPDASVSMDQVMYALALANPKTIQRGTTVNKGAILNLPAPATVLANSPAEAKAGLATLRGRSGATLSKVEKPGLAAAPVEKPSPTTKAPVASTALVLPPAPPVTKPATPAAPPAVKPSEPPPVAATPAPAKPLAKSVAEAFPSAIKPEPAKPATLAPPPAPPPAPPVPKAEAATPPPAVVAAPTVAAEAPKPEVAAAAAPAVPSAAPPAAPEASSAPAPAASAPSLSQPLPPEEAGASDILARLSDWAVPLGGLLALVLIGMIGSRMLTSGRGGKRRSSRSGSDSRAAMTATAAAASDGNGKLGDTLVDAPRSAPATALEQTQALTQRLDEAGAAPRPSAFESTLVIQPEMAASLHNTVAPTQVGQKKTDFDMTTQLQAETLHINLDANDPISEADFHLAYGLYDEAILLLKQALDKTPARDDVRVKLAETYFAAGKPMEFQLLAEELKPRLNSAEWSKIAIMGSQLCPGVALFKADAGAELVADFDLGFDEPELSLPPAPIQSIPAPISPPPSPLPPPISIEAPSLDLAPLELPDVAIPALAEVMPAVPSPVEFKLDLDPALVGDVKNIPEEDPDSIDFMLGQSITPLGAASASAPPALDSNLLEFDLDSSMNRSPANAKVKAPGVVDELPGLDFQLSLSGDAPQSSLAPAAPSRTPEPELDLADFEISLTPREMDSGSVEDEFNTKLDLARAYVEMGDNEMARGLLQEVQQQGSATQKSEASSLLERLPA